MLADKVSIHSYLPIDKVVGKIVRAIYQHRIESKGWQPLIRLLPGGTELVLLPIHPNSNLAVGLAKHPITNSQYQRFLSDSRQAKPIGKTFYDGRWVGPFSPLDHQDFNHPQKPVVCIDFKDATSYCQWLNSSFSGTKNKDKEWGNWAFLPPIGLWDFAALGNSYRHQQTSELIFLEQPNVHHKSDSPTVIDETGSRVNARGISDMFGNVWEWCSLNFEEQIALIDFGRWTDVELRGGGFLDDLTKIRTSISASVIPDGLDTKHTDLGFRIAALIPLQYLPNDARIKLELQQHGSRELWESCGRALHYPFSVPKHR